MLLAIIPYAEAQDKLITKDGEVINAWSVDIGNSSIYYKTDNTDNATIKSIPKDRILLLKKQDGTTVNLYEQTSNPEQPTTIQSKMGNNANLSAKAVEDNRSKINKLNSFVPKYVSADTDKEAARVLCVLGYGSNSQIVNDDIEIDTEAGHFGYDGKKYTYEEVTTHYYSPALVLKVRNKTNRTIYIDLGNTFFSRKNESQAYYIPTATSTGTSTSSGVSVNAGAVADALGIGGSVGKLANGIDVGSGSGKSSVNTVFSQRVIAIPPLSTRRLEPMSIFDDNDTHGLYCEGMSVRRPQGNAMVAAVPGYLAALALDRGKGQEYKRGEQISFNEDTSPVHFSAFVSYSFSEDCSEITTTPVTYFLHSVIGFSKGNSGAWVANCFNLAQDIPDYKNSIFFCGFIPKSKSRIENYGLKGSYFPRP